MPESNSFHRSTRKSLEMEQLQDVRFPISMVLGHRMLTIGELLDLRPGSVLELDRVAGENVDLVVNGKVLAKGEVVVMNNHLGFRLVTLLNPEERLKTM